MRSEPIGSWSEKKKGGTELQLHRLNNEVKEEEEEGKGNLYVGG